MSEKRSLREALADVIEAWDEFGHEWYVYLEAADAILERFIVTEMGDLFEYWLAGTEERLVGTHDELVEFMGKHSGRAIMCRPANPLAPVNPIQVHADIWEKYHKPHGITLAESKADWLEMLNQDPTMKQVLSWGDNLAGRVTPAGIATFRIWLEGDTP